MVLSSPVAMETDQSEASEEMLLHERLVEYIRQLGDHSSQRSRMGVWMEHSYARVEGAGSGLGRGSGGGAVRVLLAPPAAAPTDQVDVCEVTEPPQPPKGLAQPDWVSLEDIDDDDEEENSDWETQVQNTGRAGEALLGALAELRLAAAVYKSAPLLRPHVVRAEQRFRAVVCEALCLGEVGAVGAALRGLLGAPPAPRRLAAALLAALSPALRARAGLAPDTPAPNPAPHPPHIQPRQPLPVIIFVSLHTYETDRWRRALATLLPVKFVAPPRPAVAPPPIYAAELLAQTQELLSQQLHELGDTPSIVCGYEAGCLVAGAALGGCERAGSATSVKGLVALAPPLYTAEGEATLGARLRLPILAVVGESSPSGGRAAAGGALAGGAALVLVGGAGAALSARPDLQPALDRAIAEEVFNWAREIIDPSHSSDTGTAEEEEVPDEIGSSSGRNLRSDELSAAELLRLPVVLVPPAPAAPTAPIAPAAPTAPTPPMPVGGASIVWGEPPPAAPSAPSPASRVTITGGSNLRYTRVIVAKRPTAPTNSTAHNSAPVGALSGGNKPLFVRRVTPRHSR